MDLGSNEVLLALSYLRFGIETLLQIAVEQHDQRIRFEAKSLSNKYVWLKEILPEFSIWLNGENLLFVDYPSIYIADRDTLDLVAKDISSKRIPFSMQSDLHNIYGIWTDYTVN